MISLAAALLAASVATADTVPVDSLRALDDTVRRRPKAVHLSDWYGRRLTIHRTLSYVTLPVFGAQWIAGNQLFQLGSSAPTWAKTGHRVGATTLAGIFTVN